MGSWRRKQEEEGRWRRLGEVRKEEKGGERDDKGGEAGVGNLFEKPLINNFILFLLFLEGKLYNNNNYTQREYFGCDYISSVQFTGHEHSL